MSESDVKVCFDRVIPVEYAHIARDVSLQENPRNRSDIGFEAAAIRSKIWSSGRVLRIAFLDGDPDVQHKVVETAGQWTKHANVKFDFGNHAGRTTH